MLPKIKTTAIAAVTAASVALTTATPAAAWGQREQDFLKGAVSALLLKAIIDDARRDRTPKPVYREAPVQKRYEEEHAHRTKPAPLASSIYQTPVARAFNSYSRSERRAMQRKLSHSGYYKGGLDGSFGPGTYSAITAYAHDRGQGRELTSTAGSFGVLDGLLF